MHGVITLSGGRCLGYADYRDLHGRPVLFFHGQPGRVIWSKNSPIVELHYSPMRGISHYFLIGKRYFSFYP
jgi:hypothetical protein